MSERITPTRKEVMESSSIHQLTKDILEMSKDKDVVDRVKDVELALEVLMDEMDYALSLEDESTQIMNGKTIDHIVDGLGNEITEFQPLSKHQVTFIFTDGTGLTLWHGEESIMGETR